jgi:hypothetical protein
MPPFPLSQSTHTPPPTHDGALLLLQRDQRGADAVEEREHAEALAALLLDLDARRRQQRQHQLLLCRLLFLYLCLVLLHVVERGRGGGRWKGLLQGQVDRLLLRAGVDLDGNALGDRDGGRRGGGGGKSVGIGLDGDHARSFLLLLLLLLLGRRRHLLLVQPHAVHTHGRAAQALPFRAPVVVEEGCQAGSLLLHHVAKLCACAAPTLLCHRHQHSDGVGVVLVLGLPLQAQGEGRVVGECRERPRVQVVGEAHEGQGPNPLVRRGGGLAGAVRLSLLLLLLLLLAGRAEGEERVGWRGGRLLLLREEEAFGRGKGKLAAVLHRLCLFGAGEKDS